MAASAFSRLSTRVWKNPRLSIKTKVTVYNACVVNTFLYGSECWTTYTAQDLLDIYKHLNLTFYLLFNALFKSSQKFTSCMATYKNINEKPKTQ